MSEQEKEPAMYVKSVILKNYGPYKDVKIDFHFDNTSRTPLPLVLIGQNGSGKTIFLSHIVNALISAKQLVYTDCEVEMGKVYKYRSPNYINNESFYSYSKVEFSDNTSSVTEYTLKNTRKEVEKAPNFSQPNQDWGKIPENDNSLFNSSFTEKTAGNLMKKECILYFPSNRFEEPGWLNVDNLTNPIEYQDLKSIKGTSNRFIIATSTLKQCQSWLLDILLDRNTLELQKAGFPVPIRDAANKQQTINLSVFTGFQGQASYIYEEILKLINALFGKKQGTFRFGLGNRRNRQLSIIENNTTVLPNLFQLSSGETLLLDLFLCIIKDFDLSESSFTKLADITGVVLVDEIDAHLHGKLQKEILPSLIKLFPKVQFIITTHSPMFLLGMEQTFGTNGYDILQMPDATPVSIEGFAEFKDLFSAISETQTYLVSVNTEIKESQLPIVFVEGNYDIKYLTKTIELFYADQALLSQFRFADGEGWGNLDKIWASMNSKVANVLTSKTLLLYDCDTKKSNTDNGRISKRTIPINQNNPIKKGIENLLSIETIEKLETGNPCYIDITPATTKKIKGVDVAILEVREVNKDEKRNICDWLCQNGTRKDFEGFKPAIDIIVEFLSAN
jgi:predicted ATP-binding protein involved in virulence